MRPSFAYELARRSVENYYIIKNEEDNGKEAFATVAALSATLFCIIAFKEWKFLERINKKNLTSVISISDLPACIADLIEKYDNKESRFVDMMKLIRHSLAHSDIELMVDDEERLVGVEFRLKSPNKINDEIYKRNKDFPESIQMLENELVSLLNCLVKLFETCTGELDKINVKKLSPNPKETTKSGVA